jgi:hypothetical protein
VRGIIPGVRFNRGADENHFAHAVSDYLLCRWLVHIIMEAARSAQRGSLIYGGVVVRSFPITGEYFLRRSRVSEAEARCRPTRLRILHPGPRAV